MTRAEAEVQARGEFGEHAFVEERKLPGRLAPFSHFVGVWEAIFTPKVLGSGDSWEAAFADADRRALAGGAR